MAFANSWVETDPDGAVITGSLLDDHQRLTKRAVRERLEGDPANPNSGIFESGTFAATAIVRAGTARAYVVTAANLGTLTLQDGRIAITSDTKRLYHLKGSGLVELDYMPLTGGGTISGPVTISATGTNPLTLNRGEVGAGQMAHIFFNRNAVVKGSIGLTAGDALAINDAGGDAAIVITAGVQVNIFGSPSVSIQSRLGADTYLVMKGIAASGHLNWAIGKSFTIANALEFIPSTAADGVTFTTPKMTLTSSGLLTVTTIAGTITTAAQGNITSVGVLTGLSIATTVSTLTFSGSNAAGFVLNLNNNVGAVRGSVIGFQQNGVQNGYVGTEGVILGSVSGHIAVWADASFGINFYTNASATVRGGFTSTGDQFITSAKKFYLDGGSDTYITESAGNEIDIYTGASQALNISQATPRVLVVGRSFMVQATQKIYLDGGGDTYIYEATANRMDFFSGGVAWLAASATVIAFGVQDVYVTATKKLYLDSGGDTYIVEGAANDLYFVAGGVTALRVLSTVVYVNTADFKVDTTKKVYLDGGVDTYIYESAANQLDLVAGGTNYFRVIPNQVQVRQTASLVIDAAQKFFLDGGTGGNTYIWEQSADSLQIVAGGTVGFIMTATTLNLSNLTTITGATTYSGNTSGTHTGGVTGNLTGTVLTAAQGNITSLGTLTGLALGGAVTIATDAAYDVGDMTHRLRDLYIGGDIKGLGKFSLGDQSGGQLTLAKLGTGDPLGAATAQNTWLRIIGSDSVSYYIPAWI